MVSNCTWTIWMVFTLFVGYSGVLSKSNLDVLEEELRIKLLTQLQKSHHTEISTNLEKDSTEEQQVETGNKKSFENLETMPSAERKLNSKEQIVAKSIKKNSIKKLRMFGTAGSEVCRSFSLLSRMDSCSCRPRMTPLDVSAQNIYQNRLFPMCIEAKRCAGYCPRKNTKCVASETTMVQYPSIELIGGEAGCRAMLVEQHVACSCSCALGPETCLKNQVFDDEMCNCKCPDDQSYVKCSELGKVWDAKKCLCKCKRMDICSTGNIFDQEKCRCVSSKLNPELENVVRSLLDHEQM